MVESFDASLEGDSIQFDRRFDRVLVSVLRPEQAPLEDTRLVELESLAFLNMLMELEDEFDELWPTEYLTNFPKPVSIGRLRQLTRQLLWQERF